MSGHTATPKLVLGHILQFSLNDNVGGVPSDEAIIHFEGDEDSEINLRCPGALRLASLIVTAYNSHADLVRALEKIEKWFGEFPETGRFWDDHSKQQPMSYGAAFGSNGERDFMREIARAALATLTARKVG